MTPEELLAKSALHDLAMKVIEYERTLLMYTREADKATFEMEAFVALTKQLHARRNEMFTLAKKSFALTVA
jgi:hypothetical protein